MEELVDVSNEEAIEGFRVRQWWQPGLITVVEIRAGMRMVQNELLVLSNAGETA